LIFESFWKFLIFPDDFMTVFDPRNECVWTFYRLFLLKTKILQKIVKSSEKNATPKQNNTSPLILNCQVSTIFMNPRQIHGETLRNWLCCRITQFGILTIMNGPLPYWPNQTSYTSSMKINSRTTQNFCIPQN
jgi:hypothetical protein